MSPIQIFQYMASRFVRVMFTVRVLCKTQGSVFEDFPACNVDLTATTHADSTWLLHLRALRRMIAARNGVAASCQGSVFMQTPSCHASISSFCNIHDSICIETQTLWPSHLAMPCSSTKAAHHNLAGTSRTPTCDTVVVNFSDVESWSQLAPVKRKPRYCSLLHHRCELYAST